MHLVYIGQSGRTGTSAADPCQPHEVVAGLMLHETQCISVNGEYDALCRRHFGAPLGQPGAPASIRPGRSVSRAALLRLVAAPGAAPN